ncbi:MAG: CDP-alcohol phosphatidyltransferase family protein [Oscillospiraceae bacterium]
MEKLLMKKSGLNAANCVTALRIAGALCLLFLQPLSGAFFAVYTLTGLTDALDGWLARRTGTAGAFGARLDSIADLLFYGAMLLRVFPALCRLLPAQLWCAAAGVLFLRLSAYLIAAAKYRRFAALHTYLNKLTGAAVFLLPYTLSAPWSAGYGWAVCALAAAAALEELAIHLQRGDYQADVRSAFGKEDTL